MTQYLPMPRSSRSSHSARPSRSRFSFYNLSSETLASMVWLDPAPMPISEPIVEESGEDHDINPVRELVNLSTSEKDLTELPPPGDGRPNLIYYFSRIQRYSSWTFSIFASIHFTNTSIIPFLVKTVPASETYLLQAREIYQTPLTEPLLVGLPILAHVGGGVALRFLRRAQNLRHYGGEAPEIGSGPRRHKANLWPPFNWISLSGYIYMAFLGSHVLVNRALPLFVDGDSSNIGLSFVSHSFARYPKLSWFSYGGLVLIGCSHMVWGAAKWLGVAPVDMGWSGRGFRIRDTGIRRHRQRTWKLLHILSVGMGTFWIFSGVRIFAAGGLTEGWLRRVYDNMILQLGL